MPGHAIFCSICGQQDFTAHKVLWPELVCEWQLSEEEVAYVNEQQGCICNNCGANLRSVALARAILAALGEQGTISRLKTQERAGRLRILDMNGAPGLSPLLSELPNYVRGDYPAINMLELPYGNNSFDIVIHSDTLEHVTDPVSALRECHRVLVSGGQLCFTVPVIVGRLTRSRAGLPESYHGNPATSSKDLLVHTEFGADVWRYLFEAGFGEVAIHPVRYPAALAFRAKHLSGLEP